MFKKELGNCPSELSLRFLFVAVIMFVMVSFVCAAEESPNPIPSPGKESQPIQNSSANENQKAGALNAMSKELSAPINLQNGAPVGNQDVQDPSTQSGQASSQGWTWTWNEMTFLTLALVFVGSIQAFIYRRQARLMRKGLKVTRQSAKAAQDSADAAGRALEVVERPFLSVEQWEFEPRGNANPLPTGLFCLLRNSGRTPATLTKGSVNLIRSKELPACPDFLSLRLSRKEPFTVQAQGTLEFILPFSDGEWKEKKNSDQLYLYGYISYTDEFEGYHHIMFYIKESGRLVPVSEGGYNYHVTEEKNKK